VKITIFEVEAWEEKTFEPLRKEHEVHFVRQALTEKNAGEHSDADIVSVFIYSKLTKDVLEAFKNLKLVCTRSTGYDHIDMKTCRQKDIAVANVPIYGENTVAEHVFALLMTISHNMYESINRTRRGDFSPQGLQGFDLQGKTLGVVGTGHIGRHVIQIAKGFDMNVLAFDIEPDEEFQKHADFEYTDLKTLLSSSDIITLHIPANEKTRHFISEEKFGMMKKGTIFINTARGDVVDTRALIHALSDETIAAAGLDVLAEEPTIREEAELMRSFFYKKHNLEDLLADHILLRLRNVYITPHNAFNTREALQRILTTTLENIEAFNQGAPENLINEG
jgi:D-lactate dehydrogenase